MVDKEIQKEFFFLLNKKWISFFSLIFALKKPIPSTMKQNKK